MPDTSSPLVLLFVFVALVAAVAVLVYLMNSIVNQGGSIANPNSCSSGGCKPTIPVAKQAPRMVISRQPEKIPTLANLPNFPRVDLKLRG